MTKPTSITIPVTYDADGILECSALVHAFERALGGRICITDWYSERAAQSDYPHLSEEDRREVISCISTGDYDEAIDRDSRREVLDAAVVEAGFEPYPGDRDDAALTASF